MDTSIEKLTISRRKSKAYGGPRLRVLLTNEILCHLLPCMMPQDAVEFLGCHPQASFRSEGWLVMRKMLKMDVQIPGLESVVTYKDNRDLMLHVIRKYGLCCSDCFCLLDGPNGFFCCTSLCRDCRYVCVSVCVRMYVVSLYISLSLSLLHYFSHTY